MRKLTWMLPCVAIVFAMAFGSGFVFPLLSPKYASFCRRICFPLSDPQDVVVDNRGRIYVALGFYSRVQVYDPNGVFLYGCFVKTGGGVFRIRPNDRDMVDVAAVREKWVYSYNVDGEAARIDQDARQVFTELGEAHRTSADNASGRTCRIENRWLNPKIRVIERDRGDIVEIGTHVLLIPLIGPVPCFLCFVATSLLYNCWRKGVTGEKDRRRRREGRKGSGLVDLKGAGLNGT